MIATFPAASDPQATSGCSGKQQLRLWPALPLGAAFAICLVADIAEARVIKNRSPQSDGGADLVLSIGYEFNQEELALPVLIEWSPTDKLTLAAEPEYVWLKDDDGHWISGLGELETSAIYQLVGQAGRRPSLDFELGIKFPVESDPDLGSGEFDVTLGLILAREFDSGSAEFSISHVWVGDPPDEALNDVTQAAIAGEWEMGASLAVIGELAVSRGGEPRGTGLGGGFVSTERTGTEWQATIGLTHQISARLKLEEGIAFGPGGDWQGLIALEWELGEED
jgi:hypothetical protein